MRKMIMVRGEQIHGAGLTRCICTGLLSGACATAAVAPVDAGRANAAANVHQPATCVASERVAGLHDYAIQGGGPERRYKVFVPHSYDRERPAPAVLDIHGSGSTPQQQLGISGLASDAEARGFVVILPEAVAPYAGGGFTWNIPYAEGSPDDVMYIREVIEDATKRLCIDEARIFAMGFSGGARLASAAVCTFSQHFAGLGAVGGLRSPGACERPVPVIAFHGAADPINPYSGGGPSYWSESVDGALEGWAVRNACDTRPSRTSAGPRVARITYSDCEGATEVTLYRLEGVGHVWPGSSVLLPAERFGAPSLNVDATALVLAFFERYGLPGQSGGQPTTNNVAVR